ncbi:Rust resistance kinase Lr10 [Vitis vinifera]|uniref:Rust resistance kinase Lr10 n=1 Tax=Vitis vinifera TaxID=29760 RepID=A0A438CH87_VITVI|nr:Rust resistance kinase Lr10 [Vitis vinifera]
MSMKLLFSNFTALVLLLLSATSEACHSSCGKLGNITYPFRLKGDPHSCGRSTMNWIKDNCSSLPLQSLKHGNFSHGDPYKLSASNSAVNFLECAAPVKSAPYLDTALCSKNSSSNLSLSLSQTHSYVVVGDIRASDVEDSCSIGMVVWVSNSHLKINNSSFSGIHNGLLYGTELLWPRIYYLDYVLWKVQVPCGGVYNMESSLLMLTHISALWLDSFIMLMFPVCIMQLCWIHFFLCSNGGPSIELNIALRCCGIPCVFVFLIYKWRRRNLWIYSDIEEFIQSHNNLMPIRYSYSNIKKMTKNFKEKLGEGGFGSVFKGKLQSGRLVAVKMVNSKANGQDFINEVATIGRIHHVNVVQLIGFCAKGSKRALVFDFMPNGSLDKYIFPRTEANISLNFEKMYEISLGVAHGIEYLHRGCDMQILHFDIKPHNILLDKNFSPKVSDFGLAKLYPTDHSIVSVTAARGTMGYMAPELVYKNIGGVSYKADVYSFGMLLMEMAGRRKNLNVFAEHSSQMYFPSWVYDQFSEGKDIEMGDATEEEQKLAKKMIIVALWCIQLKPSDRPSMSKVVEMLEGNVELLQMPPKPFLTPQEVPAEDH